MFNTRPFSQEFFTVAGPSYSNATTYGDMVERYVNTRYCNTNETENLHLWLMKSGYEGDRFLTNNLINAYAKINKIEDARNVFDELSDKNTVSWTCLISGYAQLGRPHEACSFFQSMVTAGIRPTEFTFGSTLQACQILGSDGLELGTQIHALVWKTGYVFDSVVCNSLMSMYGSCRLDSIDDVLNLFQRTAHKIHLIPWNVVISIASRRGHLKKAFEIFSSMQRTDCSASSSSPKPNESTFASLITATYSSPTPTPHIALLQMIIGRITKSGFNTDLYVGSAMVTALARFGLLSDAKEVFVEMPVKNTVSMNGLMVGLVKQKHGEDALDVFREMTGTSSLPPTNSDGYLILLSACAEFASLEEGQLKGREIHGVVLRTGMEVGNGLVSLYSKCGAIDEALRVFDQTENKDTVTWNSLISGFDQNGRFEDALGSFLRMLQNGFIPSNFALISALSACASLQWLRLGRQLHSVGVKSGLNCSGDVSVCNAQLAIYGNCGCIADCWNLFDSMPGHDMVSWNSMIGALTSMDEASSAVNIFTNMILNGLIPNRVTIINILTAISSISDLRLTTQIHTLAYKCGHLGQPTVASVENALLLCYSKSDETMVSCEQLFAEMPDGKRDDVSWNSMVSGYIQNDLFPQAMDFIWLMKNIHQKKLDGYTLSTILTVCASLATLDRGMELHGVGLRSISQGLDVVVETSLVDMYSKCGRVDYASKVFDKIPSKNRYSWNSMISGFARHGCAAKALETFESMESVGCYPDHITYVGVLSACSHAGYVEQGSDHFELMTKKYGLVPRIEHYSCMVDLFGRAGRLDGVEDILEKMTGASITPNSLVWRTVLVACCRVNKNVAVVVGGSSLELGRKAGEKLVEMDSENPANYVLLSHMFAAGGRWEEVGETRAIMRRMKSGRKEPGSSWVSLKEDGLHVFVAGDRSHPEADVIYTKLREVDRRIREEEGYVPLTECALYDVESESKEEILSWHSEKIALAFVLTRRSSGELPIRIMKNLRVCVDCHLAFACISRVFKRRIVLRDSNRFHHFEDGSCSCGDYW